MAMQDHPLISVVIPCRDHAEELAHCLRALTDQTFAQSFETIVVDSAVADVGPERPDQTTDHFPACNMAIARDDFAQLGGFPAISFLACEDVRFCEQASAAWPRGLQFVNAMRVRHLGRNRLADVWRHHRRFGHCRAALGLRLQAVHLRLGTHRIMIVPVMLKRYVYILRRMARWNRAGLLSAVLLSPLLLFGLAGWAVGFRRGCIEATQGDR